jgi:hypothetical protein
MPKWEADMTAPGDRPLKPTVTRDYTATIIAVIIAVVAAAAGIALWINDYIGWTIVVAVVALIAVSIALGSHKSQCPRCNKPMRMVQPGYVNKCLRCHADCGVMDGTLKLLGPGFSGDHPILQATLEELQPVAEWEWSAPHNCCVCGEPATRVDSVGIEIATGQMLNVLEITTIKFPLGYCVSHNNGVVFFPVSGEDSQLKFRSFDYYNTFMEANRRRATSQ